jgi:CubicO group peptidase (beta-lactamase class C family)
MAVWVIALATTACSVDQNGWNGIWQTEIEATPDLRTALEFQLHHDVTQDKWSGHFEIPEMMGKGKFAGIKVNGSTLALELGPGHRFTGTLSGNKSSIGGILHTPGREPDTLHFRRVDQWSSQMPARRDHRGQAVSAWHYQPPQAGKGGWPVSALRAAAVSPGPLEKLFERVLKGEYEGLDAVLVAQGGKLVLEEYFHLGSRERIHSMQSMTKSVTSLLIGMARDSGLIRDLDVPIQHFFPGYEDFLQTKPWPVSLKHTLMMAADLDWTEDIPYTDPRNDAVRMNQSKDMYQYVLSKDLIPGAKPGERFEYNSGLSILLGGVIERTTGMPADKYARQTLFKQLGIERSAWMSLHGKTHTGGGLYMLPRDILKLGQLVLDEGQWQGQQVISQAWMKESTAFQLRIMTWSINRGYGYQWWRDVFRVEQNTFPVIYTAGYGGQFLWVIPDLNLVVLALHRNPADVEGKHTITSKEVEKIIIPAVLSNADAS